MLSIGRFSQVCRLSVRTLRRYDADDLLVPALVDAPTGRRYYSPTQVAEARLIRLLRDLDVPLSEVRGLLAVRDPAAARAALAAHRARLAEQLLHQRAVLSELDGLLADRFEESRRRRPYLYPGGLGFVVPHAGPAYCGAVAAAAYRSLERLNPEQVVVRAFPHQGGLSGVAAPDVDRISTPLGEAAIDPGFGGFPLVPDARVCDHSFEIQLPFLQRAAPRARITPLYAGLLSAQERAGAAQALAACWRPGVVVVASSDFTHYGRDFGFTPFPPDHAVAGRLRELDTECIEAAATLDSARFLETLERNQATVCGSGPIALLIETLRRLDADLYLDTLDYQTSGELTGDYRHSVSYAALGWFPRPSFDLDEGDRAALLESAERTLDELRRTGRRRAIPAQGGSPALQARRGMFVSLHQGTELLGCIGNIAGLVAEQLDLMPRDQPREQFGAHALLPGDLVDMDRVVRVKLVPLEHHLLERVEPPGHAERSADHGESSKALQ